MFSQVKKMASFFYPILIERFPSKVSGEIELSLQNGKLVMDSSTANYSYGSLHNLFRKVVKDFSFKSKHKKALILGFGGGSIAEILNVEQKLNLEITALELDRVVVAVYQKYFKKKEHNTTLIQGDALMFLRNSAEKFDYIFIDVFNNLDVPSSFQNQNFLNLLSRVCSPHTQIAMNTTLMDDDALVQLWQNHFGTTAKLKQLTNLNLVLFSLPENNLSKL